MSKIATLTGLGLAGLGLAHFVKPEAFESLTATAFPEDNRQHTYVNGGIEAALGLALAAPKTRKLATVGLLGYGGYLLANVLKMRAA